MQKEENNVCAVCNNVAKKRCSGCLAVYYCSQEHQKSHWKIHSKNCRAYKVVENSEIGRHYIATRDIKVGEVVIYDKAPLVSGSYTLRIDRINGETVATPPVCLSCYIELTADNAKACENCGWPLCLKCTKHGGECEFTIKYRKSKVCITEYGNLDEQSHLGYLAIPVIRALALRDTEPQAYRKLLSLEDHCFKMSMASNAELPHKVASFVKGFFKVQHVKEVEIAKIFRIFLVNAYEVQSTGFANTYIAVYDRASFMKHDCRANCSKTFTLEGGLMFWAAVPISKGDHITTCYVDFVGGTLWRRLNLSKFKFFDCNCERCKDPTEFGTMFNAFKCINSACGGYMLPLMFTMSGHSNFVCCKCNTEIPNEEKKILDEALYEAWTKTQKNDVSQCRKFLQEWKNVLHENHFLNVDVEIRMAIKIYYKQNTADQSDECLQDLLRVCTKLTGILQIIIPAENGVIGLLLYLKCKLTMVLNGRLYPTMTLDQAFAICRAVKKDYQEVYRLLRREPADSLEHSIAIRIHNEILKMEGLDKKLVERRISFG